MMRYCRDTHSLLMIPKRAQRFTQRSSARESGLLIAVSLVILWFSSTTPYTNCQYDEDNRDVRLYNQWTQAMPVILSLLCVVASLPDGGSGEHDIYSSILQNTRIDVEGPLLNIRTPTLYAKQVCRYTICTCNPTRTDTSLTVFCRRISRSSSSA